MRHEPGTKTTLVWASIPENLTDIERRKQFYERFYNLPYPC
jgi:hypothetical protein